MEKEMEYKLFKRKTNIDKQKQRKDLEVLPMLETMLATLAVVLAARVEA